MIWMLDSDTMIFFINGSKATCKNPSLRKQAQRIEKHCQTVQAAGDELALSAITLCELEYGMRRSGQYQQEHAAMQNVLWPFKLYPFDVFKEPTQFGLVREYLARAGQVIGVFDMLIAAHALSLGATLATNNQAHFKRVPGLQTVNWS